VLELQDPDPVSMFDHVYPHGSPEVEEERAEFVRYQASFEGSVFEGSGH
jgi:pyruvate dehydrogenase E1 component alpha subunit